MSFQPSITPSGIEQAVHGLGYRNESALKYRLIAAIKEMYGKNGEFTEPSRGIHSEDLIRVLWDVDPDPDSLRNKKKNLSSIKSSINADFKRLYKEGKNPEGIMIGPENLFTISDEAKDDILSSIRAGSTATAEIRKIAGILSTILSSGGLEGDLGSEGSPDLQQVRSLLGKIAEKMGLSVERSDMEGAVSAQSENGTNEGETPDTVEAEGEFPDADPVNLVNDHEETFQSAEIVEDADLTEVSDGEVYETLEEIDGDEEEDLEVVEDTEIFDEEMEFYGTEIVVDEDGTAEIAGPDGIAAGSGSEGGSDDAGEPLEIHEDLSVIEEDTPGEYDIDEEGTEADVEEELPEGLKEIPVESEKKELEPLEVEDEPGEIEEEESAEEFHDDEIVVYDDTALEGDAGEGELLPGLEEASIEFGTEATVGLEEASEEAVDGLESEDAGEIEEEESADEFDDGELVVYDDTALEGDGGEGEQMPGLKEGPVEFGTEATVGLEEASEEAVDGLEVMDEADEVEEEESAEEYDDVVFVEDPGEQFEGEEQAASESSGAERLQSAPVQGLSVGDEAGGTESTDKADNRVLSEKFNNSLSEMDRLYNQYLFITAGEYTVGSKNPKEKWNSARRVTLAEFYIGKFPVTNALFDVFVEKTGYRTTAERVGYGTVYYGRLQRKIDEKTGRETVLWNSSLTSKIVQGAFWYQPLGPGSTLHHKRNHPVVQISLEDAMAFAAWTGKRLPTEEEWEAASRTMKGILYPWGSRFRKDACNVEKSGCGDTTPVDRYLEFQNEYGIADALGNVMEWTIGRCEDQGERVQETVSFIAKGGSWTTSKPVSLVSRADFGPEFHSNNLGFRCVAN